MILDSSRQLLHEAGFVQPSARSSRPDQKQKTKNFGLMTPDIRKKTLHLALPYESSNKLELFGIKNGRKDVYQTTFDNLKTVSLQTGLRVKQQSSEYEWLGNTHTPMSDGRIYIPEIIKGSKILSIAVKLIQGEDFFGTTQGGAGRELDKEKLLSQYGSKIKFGKFYIEAGNLRVAKKKNGQSAAVLGSDSLVISMISHDLKNNFSEKELVQCINKNKFSAKLVNDTIKQLSSIPKKEAKAKKAIRSFVDTDVQTSELAYGLALNYRLDENLNHLDKIYKAKEYLAKLELTRIGIARDLEIPIDSLIVVDQPERFHLDLCLAEHPEGGFLLHSDKEAIEFLTRVLKEPKIKLTREDRDDLEEYLKAAEWSYLQFAKRQEKLKSQLEEAGFLVEECPARFLRIADLSAFDISYSHRDSANFLNGRSFINNINGDICHVAFGSITKALNDLFKQELTSKKRQLGFDDVFFVGKSMNNSEVDYGLPQQILSDDGALRCISYESPS